MLFIFLLAELFFVYPSPVFFVRLTYRSVASSLPVYLVLLAWQQL